MQGFVNSSMSTAPDLLSPKYRPDIDGLRAIAVLSVVGFHAFPARVPGGFVGVDIFFVISGFLISTIILENLEHGKFCFIEFYARRIRRIFPALLLVLATTLAFGWMVLLAGEFRQLGEHVAAGAAFISNLVLWRESGYFDIDAETKPLLHLWSLGIEEQYYIIWPLLLWLCAKAQFKAFWMALAICLLSFVLNSRGVVTNPVETFYSPLTRLWELLAGSILAWARIQNAALIDRFAEKLGHAGSLAGFVLIAGAIVLIDRRTAFPGWWAALPVLGAMLIIAAGPRALINNAVLARPFVVLIGLISFPLYLWHWPLLSFGYILKNESPSRTYRIFAVMAAMILAWGTYRLIEQRVRKSAHGDRLTAILVGLMIANGAVGYLVYLQNGIPSRRVVVENPVPEYSFDMDSNPAADCPIAGNERLPTGLCTQYTPPILTKTIAIWGDSSAGAWLPAFRDIGKRHDYAIINIMHLSCPPILDVRKPRFDVPEAKKYCNDGQTQYEILRYLRALHPDLIVVIGAWNSYSPQTNREHLTDQDGGIADSVSTQRVISEKLPQTLKELASIGTTVVFESWPIMPTTPKARVVGSLGLVPAQVSVKRNEFDAESQLARIAIERARSAGIHSIDPSSLICNTTLCESVVNGVHYHADRYHVTPVGAMQLRPTLEQTITRALAD